jgi:hypothetical protein
MHPRSLENRECLPASGNNNPEKTVIGNSTSRGRIILAQEKLIQRNL